MKKINKENKKCIITGDLNIDGLKINKNTHVNNFFKTALEHSFIPTITLPTRIIETQISLIDHILINTNTTKNNKNISTGNIYTDITDHLPNFITIKTHKTHKKYKRPVIRIYGEKNMSKFKELIANSDWEDFYNIDDANSALNIFYNTYNKAFNDAFPLKKLSIKRAKDKRWITTALKTSIKTKDTLYKTFQSTLNI
jgi:hypothetical protein